MVSILVDVGSKETPNDQNANQYLGSPERKDPTSEHGWPRFDLALNATSAFAAIKEDTSHRA